MNEILINDILDVLENAPEKKIHIIDTKNSSAAISAELRGDTFRMLQSAEEK